jgi:hypothetical protein
MRILIMQSSSLLLSLHIRKETVIYMEGEEVKEEG